MKFTVFGSKGFIGSRLAAKLGEDDCQIILPARDDNLEDLGHLGHVIYCVGLTSDFRTRTYDTIEAHICLWSRILQQCAFETCTYLSSTRVYLGSQNTNENTALSITPSNADDLYNISKLAGESLCLKTGKGKVIRISNVIGKHNESSPGFIN
ncbi:MAG: NAD-dependent epimerase/dehydratase family protein, partial [Gammaproteobacteria bacterium]|nr:NAD-dependent epimerase/dehydratase family protein [Gammaproteobacteria bacterium]